MRKKNKPLRKKRQGFRIWESERRNIVERALQRSDPNERARETGGIRRGIGADLVGVFGCSRKFGNVWPRLYVGPKMSLTCQVPNAGK